tara:strand:- start:311 stop:637 length:327 start_codon:yes stop_codon:yes gene_type:complete
MPNKLQENINRIKSIMNECGCSDSEVSDEQYYDEPILNISYDDESMEYELGEQDAGTESGESDDAAGAGTAAMGVWDSGVARGIANQITNSKWVDSYATTRGKANPLV